MSSFYEISGEDKVIPGTGDVDIAMFIYKWNINRVKGLARIDAAAHYLWDVGNSTKDGLTRAAGDDFDLLTRSEKLGIIEKHLKKVEKDLASAWYISKETDEARDAAIIVSDDAFADLEPDTI